MALYIAYEFGRFNAGYDRLAVAQQRTEYEVAIDRLQKSNRELRTQLAELDTIRIGRAREQAEVARTIGDLQAQVARQTQELAFYRGIVAQGAAAVGVKVQQVRITPGTKPDKFVLHVELVRSVRPDNVASGAVGVTVDGAGADGKATTIDLPALTAGRQHELPYNFRYFENLDQEVAFPAGFKPDHVAVELRSSRKDVPPATQSFPWSVDAS
ncbi:MAG TPA: DUF6776 family protein [Steroidobacteraceae bacterium]|nr:DUF6776 family protein [Steroidobacteraceae bacterium]